MSSPFAYISSFRRGSILFLTLISACVLFRSPYDKEEVEIEGRNGRLHVSKDGEPITGNVKENEAQLGPTTYEVENGVVQERSVELPFHDLLLKKRWTEDSIKLLVAHPEAGPLQEKVKPLDAPDSLQEWNVTEQNLMGPEAKSYPKKDLSEKYLLYGDVRKPESGQRLEEAFMILKDQKGNMTAYVTDTSGHYEFSLARNKVYQLTCRKPGRSQRTLEISTRNIPDEDWRIGGFKMKVEMALMADPSPELRRFLKDTVIGKATYDKDSNSVNFITPHTRKMLRRLRELREE